MKSIAVATLLTSTSAFTGVRGPNHRYGASLTISRMSDNSNADMFGVSTSTAVAPSPVSSGASNDEPNVSSEYMNRQKLRYQSEADRLRQEAAEMEIALREEARAKGLSEEMVNKLIPKPRMPSSPSSSSVSSASGTAVLEMKPETKAVALTIEEVRSKLGYLNAGDAVRMTSELDRVKSKGAIRLWNSKDLGKPNFQVSNGQLTMKTSIDPLKLRLDDVGYDYQKVFVAAIVTGTVCGLGSSTIGGEIGFLLGYLSALLPIALVGVGSIAPALIFDVISKFKYATDAEARDRYVHMNAGKFLVGYVMGLPVARFDVGGASNVAEFYQLRPTGRSEAEDKLMFSRKSFSQVDIARCSAACVAGSVAECLTFGQASGNNPGDVNTLNSVMSAVEPSMTTEKAQDHIRWSAVCAHSILSAHKEEYLRLVEAFRAGLPLEECIAAIEGSGPLKIV